MSNTLNKPSPFHNTLFSEPDNSVYAVLDGAAIPGLLNRLNQFQAEYICLYRGELAADIAATAPYLVTLSPDTELTNWLLSLIGHHSGIFARTTASMREMRQHLRTFLMVYDPESKAIYFRYYDPRVLRTYLSMCSDAEAKIVFGPITHYFVENETGDQLLSFMSPEKQVKSARK